MNVLKLARGNNGAVLYACLVSSVLHSPLPPHPDVFTISHGISVFSMARMIERRLKALDLQNWISGDPDLNYYKVTLKKPRIRPSFPDLWKGEGSRGRGRVNVLGTTNYHQYVSWLLVTLALRTVLCEYGKIKVHRRSRSMPATLPGP
jgi:hypothetical protein